MSAGNPFKDRRFDGFGPLPPLPWQKKPSSQASASPASFKVQKPNANPFIGNHFTGFAPVGSSYKLFASLPSYPGFYQDAAKTSPKKGVKVLCDSSTSSQAMTSSELDTNSTQEWFLFGKPSTKSSKRD